MNKEITIFRKKEINNGVRKINILIDNKEKVRLSGFKKRIVLDGTQTVKLKAKIDWCYSPELELFFDEQENHKNVMVSSQLSNIYVLILFVVLFAGILLTMIFGNWLFLIPFFLMYLKPLYFITIGRKNYLKIIELKNGNPTWMIDSWVLWGTAAVIAFGSNPIGWALIGLTAIGTAASMASNPGACRE